MLYCFYVTVLMITAELDRVENGFMIVSATILNTVISRSTHTVLNTSISRRIQYGMASAVCDRIENGLDVSNRDRIEYG